MATGKCPNAKCGQLVGTLIMEEIEALEPSSQKRFRAIALSCQYCRTIISTSINPWMVKTEIVAEIASLLGR